jgi:hypothetical protein
VAAAEEPTEDASQCWVDAVSGSRLGSDGLCAVRGTLRRKLAGEAGSLGALGVGECALASSGSLGGTSWGKPLGATWGSGMTPVASGGIITADNQLFPPKAPTLGMGVTMDGIPANSPSGCQPALAGY